MGKRYHILDEIRGITLCSMILYHAVWDLVYIFGRDWAWYRSDIAYIWQQSICCSFILLSGFCFSLGKKKFRRGVIVFAAGAVVSLVTEIFMPQNRIRFGVLTLLGSCMLILAMVEKRRKLFRVIECKKEELCISAGRLAVWGIFISLGLFVLTRQVNYGVIGFGDVSLCALPATLYQLGDVGNFLGFTEASFYSTDYFSLFPWLFLFLAGYFCYKWMDAREWIGKLAEVPTLGRFWRPIGRNSLLIYMLHQPIVYGILYVLL